MFTVIGGALLGGVVTVISGREPGFALGLLVFLATAIAVVVVRPRAAYLVIPVPALAYVVAAIGSGYLHDRAMDTSHTALAISGLQWVASGFVAMTASTSLAIVVAATRWIVSARIAAMRSSTAPRRTAGSGLDHGRPARRPAAADLTRPEKRNGQVDGRAERPAPGLSADPHRRG